MEDDKGLDLSLGLPVGGSSSKLKDRNDSTIGNTGKDETDKTLKIVNDFKNFLNGGIPQQMPSTSFQGFDVLKPQGSYFNAFHSPLIMGVGDASGDSSGPRFWKPTTEKEVDVGEKGPNLMVGDKRKNSFEEISNNQKKQVTETFTSDFPKKTKTSHISIATDDGSTAHNEDVAESEAGTSRPVSNLEDSSKQHVNSAGNSSDVSKEMHGKGSPGNLPPFSQQPASTLNVPCPITKAHSGQVVCGPGPGSLSYPVPSAMASSTARGDRPQGSNPSNLTNTFGYSHGPILSLDKDRPWGLVTHGQSLYPPFADKGLSASASAHVANHSLPDGKQPALVVEESSLPSRAEDSSTPGISDFKAKPGAEVPAENGGSLEYPSIRPGMAADLKFGGSGSAPNLPWVSTTGPGSNGRAISGVTYKFSASQIKIVCACHGQHFSPEEFIQHASEEPPLPPPVGADNNAVNSLAGLASVTVGTTNSFCPG